MMTLRSTPANPVPPEGVLVEVRAADGLGLRAAHWRQTTRRCKGTVCLLQGRAEFIEKYYETIADLRARGFCVVAFDWRGQGESARHRGLDDPHRGHVGDFDEYRLDLLAIAETILVPLMPEPHFCLAHSMGGSVALTGALEGWLPFSRIVTVAPMLSIRMVKWPAFASVMTRALHRLGLGGRYIPWGGPASLATRPFSDNRLSRDPARYARNAAAAAEIGAGAIGDPSIAWTAAAFRAIARLRQSRAPRANTIPTLIVAAGDDPVCGTPAAEFYAARLKGGHLLVLANARHEILSERDAIRADFWAAFEAFVPGTPPPKPSESREMELVSLSAV